MIKKEGNTLERLAGSVPSFTGNPALDAVLSVLIVLAVLYIAFRIVTAPDRRLPDHAAKPDSPVKKLIKKTIGILLLALAWIIEHAFLWYRVADRPAGGRNSGGLARRFPRNREQ